MVQEFRVVRCYSCQAYQVDQVKRSTNKWTCHVCHEKQSWKQSFCKGSGKECRLACQELNMRRMKVEIEDREALPYGDLPNNALDVSSPSHSSTSNSIDYLHNEEFYMKGQSKWSKFLEEPVKNDKEAEIDNDTNIKVSFRGEYSKKSRKRKSSSSQVSNKQKVKYTNPTCLDDWNKGIKISKENHCVGKMDARNIEENSYSRKTDKRPPIEIITSNKLPLTKWSDFLDDDTDLIDREFEIEKTDFVRPLRETTNVTGNELKTTFTKKSKWDKFLDFDSPSESEL